MAYYADSVTDVCIDTSGRFAVVRGKCTYDCVQCYLAGVLVASKQPSGESVEFDLPVVDGMDVVFLLAVDADSAETDYFDDAFPASSSRGNRIVLKVSTSPDNEVGDLVRYYRGDAGDASAGTKIDEREMFPAGRRAGGWGENWGYYWGIGPFGPGWGYNWGYVWGYGADVLEFKTDPLPPGTYPVKATIVDRAGNESTDTTASVVLNTYARPASGLTIDSYVKGTDTLTLSWTASEDIP